MIGQKETVFDKPMTPAEIQNIMYTTVMPFDVIQAVLQQEVKNNNYLNNARVNK